MHAQGNSHLGTSCLYSGLESALQYTYAQGERKNCLPDSSCSSLCSRLGSKAVQVRGWRRRSERQWPRAKGLSRVTVDTDVCRTAPHCEHTSKPAQVGPHRTALHCTGRPVTARGSIVVRRYERSGNRSGNPVLSRDLAGIRT